MHIIQKEILDFSFSDETKGRKWSQTVASSWQDKIERNIEEILNKYDSDSQLLIPKITLELGEILEKDMADRIAQCLEKEMRKYVSADRQIQKGWIANEPKLDVTNQSLSLLQILAYFLNHGVLPWYSSVTSLIELEYKINKILERTEQNHYIQQSQMLSKAVNRERLYHQFSEDFRIGLLSKYFASNFSFYLKICETIDSKIQLWYTPAMVDSEGEKDYKKNEVLKNLTTWMSLLAEDTQDHWAVDLANWYYETRFHHFSTKITRKIRPLFENKLEYKTDNNLFIEQLETNLDAQIFELHKIESKKLKDGTVSAEKKEPDTDFTGNISKKISLKSKNDKQDLSKAPDDEDIDHLESQQDNLSVKTGRESNSVSNQELITNEKTTSREQAETSQSFNPKSNKKKEKPTANLLKDEDQLTLDSSEDEDINTESDSQSKRHDESLLKSNSIKNEKSKQIINKRPNELIKNAPEEQIQSPEHDVQIANEYNKDDGIAYYVNNCGIVLCWPYLSSLFKILGYTENGLFKTVSEHERAIHLLGYIATGKFTNQEHLMTIPKVLSGWPISKPIVQDVDLKRDELKEARKMLKVLIGHWSILKNTSIEGLRETFFDREGKLTIEEDHLKLIVDQRSSDILLDHLPFGISLITLSWLTKFIKVDWT